MGDILRPEIRLGTEDMALRLGRQSIGSGIKAVSRFHGNDIGKRERLSPLVVFLLIVVEIAMARGRHDDIMPFTRSLQAPFHAAPAHDRGTLVDVALHQLVPADEFPPMGVKESLHALGEIPLQTCLRLLVTIVFQAQVLDALLATRTFLPPHLRSLVAADMNVFRRENLHQFRQHTLHERERLLLAGTQDIVEDAPMALHLVRTTRASQFRISLQRAKHVARHVDLGNHRDKPLLRIAHNLLQFLLRVAAAVRRPVINRRVASQYRIVTHRALLRQLRIAVDGHAPALVVGQMPMETVHVVHRHRVEVLLHKLHAEEMARHVEVHAPVGKARRILNNSGWKDGLALQSRQRLAQGLNTIENTLGRLPLDGYHFPVHDDAIAFRLRHLRIQLQHDRTAAHRFALNDRLDLSLLLQIVAQKLRIPRQRGILRHDNRLGIQRKCPTLLHHDTPRQGHHVILCHILRRSGSHVQRKAQSQHHSKKSAHMFQDYCFMSLEV